MVCLRMFLRLGLCTVFLLSLGHDLSAQTAEERTKVIKLWSHGKPAFGIGITVLNGGEEARDPHGTPLAPSYTQAGERFAQNKLLDFVFLNLEQHYDFDAVTAIASGLRSGYEEKVGEISLVVQIPPIWEDGEEVARQRVAECLGAGADGIAFAYVRSAEMARTAVSFLTEIGANVWSPQNPGGTIISWLMIEDLEALAETEKIANVPGFSVLAGSFGRILGGNQKAMDAGNEVVLKHAKRTGHPFVTLGNAGTAAVLMGQGYLGLMMYGPEVDEDLRIAHKAARTLHMR